MTPDDKEAPPSRECRVITDVEELIAMANGFLFMSRMYGALLYNGIDFRSLSEHVIAERLVADQRISFQEYMDRMDDAVSRLIEYGAPEIKQPTVDDEGHA